MTPAWHPDGTYRCHPLGRTLASVCPTVPACGWWCWRAGTVAGIEETREAAQARAEEAWRAACERDAAARDIDALGVTGGAE